MKYPLILALLLAGCGAKPETETETETKDQTTIPLYPGYVAKAQGIIMWFPVPPEFDERAQAWTGKGAVEITSCIADPWPGGPGGEESHMAVGQENKSYTSGDQKERLRR
jgi:hypothetical protein